MEEVLPENILFDIDDYDYTGTADIENENNNPQIPKLDDPDMQTYLNMYTSAIASDYTEDLSKNFMSSASDIIEGEDV
jgi:hypothetical protein